MAITLYTPATGFPDLEAKIAYGLARVGIEAFGMEKITIHDEGGFYKVVIGVDENESEKLEKTLNLLCRRLLSSSYIPFSTPGIGGRSAESIPVSENEIFSLDNFKSMPVNATNKKSEDVCRHRNTPVGNIIGFAVATSYHHKRDGLDISIQQNVPRRPTNPKNICKICALLSLLGMWYASFIYNVSDREVIAIPILKGEINGIKLQEIYSLQHQIRRNWINQKIPQVAIPLVFLSQIPSSADILVEFDLFVAVLSRQQGYHVDGLFLIPIENYLDFIRQTPYNIATIDKLLNTFGDKRYPKEAYDALIELNNAIYYRKSDSLLKFARLYALETAPKDSNKWINLLYPETTKYLLKEVAMIRSEIIENPALGSLARTLRYFIREKKYSYADDIRNARKDSTDFEETIAKMLRESRLRLEQKEKIHLPTDEEIKEIFHLANENFESTKLALVMLAFSFPSSSEEQEAKEVENEI
jgi:CRISPR type I-A-associated protein Csa5